ncbi:MAG: hypothetical protein O3C21_09455, partial [Verrucomicrobia bacterium]|nr:hypothetical protein [Verrucomicrobiota bacterium]
TNDFASKSGSVTLAAGQSSASILIAITDDQTDEPNETLSVTLTNPRNAALALASGRATILDDDAPATVSVADASAAEGDDALLFPVRLSTASAFSVEVTYTVKGESAKAGTDFEPTEGVLVIPPGSGSAVIRVSIIDDTIDEFAENLSVVLSSPVRGTLADSSATGTIEDNDNAPEVSIASASGSESAASISLRVTLSAPSGKQISMDCLTRGATAVQGVDFVPESGPLSIPAGAQAALIVIPLIADELNEADETFEVALSNPENATIVQAIGIGSILNDDAMPRLNIGNGSGKESTSEITLPVTLSAASGRRIEVRYVLENITAKAGQDFIATNGTLVFEPGVTQGTIAVKVINDSKVEAPEQLMVSLSSATYATIEDGRGLGIIGDDDEEESNETRPRALNAYAQGRLSWFRDPDTGERFLKYVVPHVPALDRFDVTPEVSTDCIHWTTPTTGDWVVEREGESIYAIIRATGNERAQYVRFVLTEK